MGVAEVGRVYSRWKNVGTEAACLKNPLVKARAAEQFVTAKQQTVTIIVSRVARAGRLTAKVGHADHLVSLCLGESRELSRVPSPQWQGRWKQS